MGWWGLTPISATLTVETSGVQIRKGFKKTFYQTNLCQHMGNDSLLTFFITINSFEEAVSSRIIFKKVHLKQEINWSYWEKF